MCDNCKGLEGFWCPVCQPPKGIDTRDIHARAPIDRIKALEAEVERLRAESDTLRLENAALKLDVEKWRNAHRSRIKCPNGHAPKDSRGPCAWCDAEKNAQIIANLTYVAGVAQEGGV